VREPAGVAELVHGFLDGTAWWMSSQTGINPSPLVAGGSVGSPWMTDCGDTLESRHDGRATLVQRQPMRVGRILSLDFGQNMPKHIRVGSCSIGVARDELHCLQR
jgi:hypothetical protein